MINIKELRIGNYLEIFGNIREIEGIFNLPKRKNMYWIKCKGLVEIKIIHFKPIPITEDWLFNFGFQESYESGYYFKEELIINIELDCYLKGDFTDLHIKSIGYVHELQNLYFKLTGKELILKDS